MFLSINLSAQQPRITSITTRDFTDLSPKHVAFYLATNENGTTTWRLYFSQTDQLCREVTLQFTTRSNRTYQIQSRTGFRPVVQTGGLVTGDPWHTLTMPVQGTGGIMTWTMGTPFNFQTFRLVER